MSVDLGAMKRATAAGLSAAVHRNRTFSRAGALERLFTFAFRGLVYPQIWEDPVVDRHGGLGDHARGSRRRDRLRRM